MQLVPIPTEHPHARRERVIEQINEALSTQPIASWRDRPGDLFDDMAKLGTSNLLPPKLVCWPVDDDTHRLLSRLRYAQSDIEYLPQAFERVEWIYWAGADLINHIIRTREIERGCPADWWPSDVQVELRARQASVYVWRHVWRHVFADLVDGAPSSTEAYVEWYLGLARLMRALSMTMQSIFDRVAAHLLNQNRRSVDPVDGLCLYRGGDGRKCAIGCLIPDDLYSPEMENQNLYGPLIRAALGDFLRDSEHEKLLSMLQLAHDSYHPSQWPDELRYIAGSFKLSDAVVKESSR